MYWHYLLTLTNHAAASGGALCGDAGTCATGLPVVAAGSSQLHEVLAIIFGVLAAVSVLMIVIAGLRFVVAQGNSQEVSKARSTIMYALIGLIVSLIAEALVAFVLDKL